MVRLVERVVVASVEALQQRGAAAAQGHRPNSRERKPKENLRVKTKNLQPCQATSGSNNKKCIGTRKSIQR
jgi:hypothetical protein